MLPPRLKVLSGFQEMLTCIKESSYLFCSRLKMTKNFSLVMDNVLGFCCLLYCYHFKIMLMSCFILLMISMVSDIIRYVTSGRIGYVEKYVENGAETASALRDMADMYAMFIVGKGGRAQSPLTIGLSDWEECPELGTVGDFLASPEFDLSGSVLVVQQFRPSKSEKNDP